ncbi:Disintegrin and metalloproteinase domain-containing protein 32 [Lemmus lemmus]
MQRLCNRLDAPGGAMLGATLGATLCPLLLLLAMLGSVLASIPGKDILRYPNKQEAIHCAPPEKYPKNMTLEAFSVIVTQMLGLSLGISYDDPAKCPCSEAICIMTPRAMQSAGVKVFSNCSLSDFESFKSNVGAKCLQNKPQMQLNPRPVCGDGRVEGDEICDCGSQQFVQQNHVCRPPKHEKCDLPEVCNGSSGHCPPDVTIHDGHTCRDGGSICYNGDCPDLNKRCEEMYGKGKVLVTSKSVTHAFFSHCSNNRNHLL